MKYGVDAVDGGIRQIVAILKSGGENKSIAGGGRRDQSGCLGLEY